MSVFFGGLSERKLRCKELVGFWFSRGSLEGGAIVATLFYDSTDVHGTLKHFVFRYDYDLQKEHRTFPCFF